MPRTMQKNTKSDGVNQSESKTEKRVKKKFDKEEYIACRSITVGGLYLTGIKSGEDYRWTDYGDISEVQYQDLATMVRSKNNSYIYGPLFVIEDEEFIEEFPQLKKFYDDQYTVKELEKVLTLPVKDMVNTIKDLPKGAKQSLRNIASTQVVNGELDSVKKIKALDELFGTELNLLSSIFSED